MKSMKTIDVTPTWDAVMRQYLKMYDIMNPEGKKIAREEMIRCGEIAQKYVELEKVGIQKIISLFQDAYNHLSEDQISGFQDGTYDDESTPWLDQAEEIIKKLED